jgi:hypothetical protein
MIIKPRINNQEIPFFCFEKFKIKTVALCPFLGGVRHKLGKKDSSFIVDGVVYFYFQEGYFEFILLIFSFLVLLIFNFTHIYESTL